MANNSFAGNVGKGALGFGVGLALYFLIRNLGFGGGSGIGGRGEDTRGEGASPGPPAPFPRDSQMLEFWMVQPTPVDNSTMGFRGPGEKIYSLEELIARIKAGGRLDVALKVRGEVITEAVDSATEQLQRAGIGVFKPSPLRWLVSPDGPKDNKTLLYLLPQEQKLSLQSMEADLEMRRGRQLMLNSGTQIAEA